MTAPDFAADVAGTRSRLRRRYAADRRFAFYGRAAIALALLVLLVLLASIVAKGYGAFMQTQLRLEITFDPAVIDPDGGGDPARLRRADYGALIKQALAQRFADADDRQSRRARAGLVSLGADTVLRDLVLADPRVIGTSRPVWLVAADDVDMFAKGHVRRDQPEAERRLSDQVLAWLESLAQDDALRLRFSRCFFLCTDSREPEMAGILGAAAGSFWTMLVTLLLSMPLGVMTAVYLEELAPKNRWTDLIEVNINNLAAVPSVVFGLLGLALFLNFFGMPRSAPLVGGLVLSLMTLPVVIISARAALQSVPPSIRDAALSVGASRLQSVWHHVLPLALPGMLTGTIIGMARALGETAPLLMIGMVAFIVSVPTGMLDPATVMPVQIYLWADSPERAFAERTAAAILVLLAFLLIMNGLALYLRRRYERRW